ncbi:MAG: sulfatase-like hydrolase/transferase [Capsulimonadaceae bacterium]|nr:sulfatase-like hydrolase/transferase [Capsulimonadaceae bacterium]
MTDQTPNLLFIMADDHAGYVLGCDGNALAETPNLDRLAKDGVRLASHYCNSPVCSPSRQSILTGKLPHAASVTVNSSALDVDTPTIASSLLAAGYETAAMGVMHFNKPAAPGLHGFATVATEDVIRSEWSALPYRQPSPEIAVKPPWKPFRDPSRIWLNADALPYPRYAGDMEDDYLVRRASCFLEQHAATPFALWVSFHEPHSPYDFPIEDAGAFDPALFPTPEVGPDDADQIPLIFRDVTPAEKQGITAAYYTSVRYMDRKIGELLDKLDELGIANNTLVVYLPDHGYCLGHHGRFEKHCCFEQAIRVPCILRWPKRLAPGVVTAPTESVDIAPTLLDLLGAAPLPGAQGMSLVQGDGLASTHQYTFTEYTGNEEACIRTPRWKLIHCSGRRARADGYITANPTPGRSVRLFNLVDDPGEMHSVAVNRPEIVAELSGLLLARLRSTHPDATAEPEGLDIGGAIDWYLCPRDI